MGTPDLKLRRRSSDCSTCQESPPKGAADAAVLHIDALEREFAEPQCEEIT